jgi:hypothetical protein
MAKENNIYLCNKDIRLIIALAHACNDLTPSEKAIIKNISALGTKNGAFL